jgi:hypothetical protein
MPEIKLEMENNFIYAAYETILNSAIVSTIITLLLVFGMAFFCLYFAR